MRNDSPPSATGGLWRTLLIIWATVMAGMYAVAVTWSQGGATALQIFGYGIPLLTAVLAFRGVRETLHRQAGTSGLPDRDLDVALDMVRRAIEKLAALGEIPGSTYDEQQKGCGHHGNAG